MGAIVSNQSSSGRGNLRCGCHAEGRGRRGRYASNALKPLATATMQLNFFDHGRDMMLRNDVLAALTQHDAAAARALLQAYADEFPGDEAISQLAILVSALEQRSDTPFARHDVARQARLVLVETIEPSALRMFGAQDGAVWVAARWCEAARRAAALPFRSDHSEEHPAALWLRAGDAQAASDAVARIESWRRIPAPLAWMGEARYRMAGRDEALPLLAELAWLAPGRFADLIKRLADASLDKLRKAFDAQFEGEGGVADLAWFPAWLLIEDSRLAPLLRNTQPSLHTAPEQAMRLLLELLNLERHGRHHQMVERRKALRDMQPSLYNAYMKTR